MSDYKTNILKKIMAKKADEEGIGSKILSALDTPGRVTRAGIDAYQHDKPVLSAMGDQIGSDAPPVASGADIAEKFGQDHDITNPYALGGIATAADLIDPTMLVPGGQIAKLGKLGKLGAIRKMAGKGRKAEHYADASKRVSKEAAKSHGKVGVIKTAEEIAEEEMKIAGKARAAKQKVLRQIKEDKKDQLERLAKFNKIRADRIAKQAKKN